MPTFSFYSADITTLDSINDLGEAMPYLYDILNDLEEIENRIEKIKKETVKTFAKYDIKVNFDV
jgi:hypothetical protein